MASSRLFEMLAEAEARPSRAFQDVQAALGAIDKGIEGYQKGYDIKEKFRKDKMMRGTIREALGGRQIEGVPAGIHDLPYESLEIVSKIAPFQKKEERSGENFTPEQAAFNAGDEKLVGAFRKQYGEKVPSNAVSQLSTSKRSAANLDFRETGRDVNVGKQFDSDPDVRKAVTEVTQSKRAKQVLLGGGPIGDASIRVIAARAAGEVGNLAQNEQSVFGGSPALTDWINRSYERITSGNLDEQDRQYLNQLFDVYQKYGEERLNQRKKYHANRYSEVTGIPVDKVEKMIGSLSDLGVQDGSSQGGGDLQAKASASISKVMNSNLPPEEKKKKVLIIQQRLKALSER